MQISRKSLLALKTILMQLWKNFLRPLELQKKNIFNNMKKLQENGLLRRVGADKNGWWEVADQ